MNDERHLRVTHRGTPAALRAMMRDIASRASDPNDAEALHALARAFEAQSETTPEADDRTTRDDLDAMRAERDELLAGHVADVEEMESVREALRGTRAKLNAIREAVREKAQKHRDVIDLLNRVLDRGSEVYGNEELIQDEAAHRIKELEAVDALFDEIV